MTVQSHVLKKTMHVVVCALLCLSSINLPGRAADGDTPSPASSPADSDDDASGKTPAATTTADPASTPAAAPAEPPATPLEKRSVTPPTPSSLTKVSSPHEAVSSAPAPATKPAAKPPAQSLTLTGRIEELCKGNTATLPLKWKKMEPIRDTRLDGKTLAGNASTAAAAAAAQAATKTRESYPMDFRGTWAGTLTIFNRTYAPLRFQLDKAEAEKESRILTPGRTGQVSLTFYQKPDRSVTMEPCQVIFTSTTSMADATHGLGMNAAQAAMFGNMQVPVAYALHLGNLTSAVGVTGNQLQSRLMKNDLKQLRSDVVEQVVVTRDSDRNTQTGTTRLGYSESVLRFTRISSNQLYFQSASVNYQNDGKFLDKVILYGTLNRVANGGTAAVPGLPGLPGFPGAAGQAGGGNVMDAMRQLQQMMQQMQR